MKQTILIILAIFAWTVCFSQSKKDVKKNKIKSIQEYVTETKNGKTIKYLDASKEYDKRGCNVSDIEYHKNGSIKKKELHKYNADKDKIETIEYDSVGFVQKIVYSYNAEGDKSKELFYDEKGVLIKEVVYSYNNKQLKTERRSTNNKKLVEQVRNWMYEFYK